MIRSPRRRSSPRPDRIGSPSDEGIGGDEHWLNPAVFPNIIRGFEFDDRVLDTDRDEGGPRQFDETGLLLGLYVAGEGQSFDPVVGESLMQGDCGPVAQIDAWERDLRDPARGFILVRGMLSSEEVEAYREESREFMARGRKIFYRMNRPGMNDYVHPRSPSENQKRKVTGDEPDTYRIYQFLWNRHSASTETIFDRVLSLRNALEGRWNHDQVYRAARDKLRDYVQVTRYADHSPGLPLHRDTAEDLPFPLLQPFLLLSRPEFDFAGGATIVHPWAGRPLRTDTDLGMGLGDLLLFDKSLYHEVEPILPVAEGVGRWSVVIGARGEPRGTYWDRFRYGEFAHCYARPAGRRARRLLRAILRG